MMTTKKVIGDTRSRDLVDGIAATLRHLEREVAGLTGEEMSASAARRLETFRRSLARTLQQAHLETVQEMTAG
jgi:hypothetical protein